MKADSQAGRTSEEGEQGEEMEEKKQRGNGEDKKSKKDIEKSKIDDRSTLKGKTKRRNIAKKEVVVL